MRVTETVLIMMSTWFSISVNAASRAAHPSVFPFTVCQS